MVVVVVVVVVVVIVLDREVVSLLVVAAVVVVVDGDACVGAVGRGAAVDGAATDPVTSPVSGGDVDFIFSRRLVERLIFTVPASRQRSAPTPAF